MLGAPLHVNRFSTSLVVRHLPLAGFQTQNTIISSNICRGKRKPKRGGSVVSNEFTRWRAVVVIAMTSASSSCSHLRTNRRGIFLRFRHNDFSYMADLYARRTRLLFLGLARNARSASKARQHSRHVDKSLLIAGQRQSRFTGPFSCRINKQPVSKVAVDKR